MSALAFSQSPQVGDNLQIHNTCLTAKSVCTEATISEIFEPRECFDALEPQFFKFFFIDSGTIELNTNPPYGTYTLYGPMINNGFYGCQEIALGQANQLHSTLSGNLSLSHGEGYYILKVNITDCSMNDEYNDTIKIDVSAPAAICTEPPNCIDCISSFSPNPGKYILSAWVKGEAANKNTSYLNPKIEVSFIGDTSIFSFAPSGIIIDDWQKIEGEVIVPPNATDIKIKLECQSGNCYFDDIRFVPLNGSMKSYVYDPVSLRLVAELDERNYATFYEYDEEGKLIRVKKETEKGIMTIQENRNSIIKR